MLFFFDFLVRNLFLLVVFFVETVFTSWWIEVLKIEIVKRGCLRLRLKKDEKKNLFLERVQTNRR